MKCMWVTTICLVGPLIGDVRAQPTSDGPSLRFGILRQQRNASSSSRSLSGRMPADSGSAACHSWVGQ